MTTLVPFVPSNMSAPSFAAILDGATYNVVLTWNISAKRYYVNIYDNAGTWIVTTPLVTTPTGEAIASVSYDTAIGVITATKVAGLWKKPGTMVDYTLSGFDPASLNGLRRCLTVRPPAIQEDGSGVRYEAFTFPFPSDPGTVAILGSANRLMNMVAGVFKQSTLVYRNGSFEVSP